MVSCLKTNVWVFSKGIAPHIEVKQTKLQQFEEFDNAFVSNVIGGGRHEVAVAAKL